MPVSLTGSVGEGWVPLEASKDRSCLPKLEQEQNSGGDESCVLLAYIWGDDQKYIPSNTSVQENPINQVAVASVSFQTVFKMV